MDIRPLALLALALLALALTFAFAFALAPPAQAQSCASDEACQDGSWCNGIERCEGNPTRGMCMPAPEPMCPSKKVCDEVGKRCLSQDAAQRKLTVCAKGETYSEKEKQCVATPPQE